MAWFDRWLLLALLLVLLVFFLSSVNIFDLDRIYDVTKDIALELMCV